MPVLPDADLIARWPLSPLLAAQALWVRGKAVSLPEASGPRHGTAGSGAPLRVLIAGDSSAAGVGVSEQSQALSGQLTRALSRSCQVHWRLCAATGATTARCHEMLIALPAEPFDVAVTALGVNDVTRLVSHRRFVARQQALLQLLRHRFSVRHILVTGVPPMGAFPLLPHPLRWVLGAQAARMDQALQQMLAQDPTAHHIAVTFPPDPAMAAEDGYHPSAAAYTLWADTMAQAILSRWSTPQQ